MTFTIRGEADYIQFNYIEIFGFPNETCHWGGYDARVDLEIKSRGFSVKAILYSSTGELYEFFEKLKLANENLSGEIRFTSYEGNLEFTISYDKLGHAAVKGSFCEQNEYNNLLQFDFLTDQTFIDAALTEMSAITAKYGGMQGMK